MRWQARALAGLALIAATGCSPSPRFDAESIEADVRDRLEDLYEVPIASVSCPEGVEVEAGAAFECAATTSAGRVDVVVRQIDGDGVLAVEPAQAVLVTERVAEDIAAVLADRFDRDDALVSCPGAPVRVEEVGGAFTCRALHDGEARSIEVTVRDAGGALTYSLAEPDGGDGELGG